MNKLKNGVPLRQVKLRHLCGPVFVWSTPSMLPTMPQHHVGLLKRYIMVSGLHDLKEKQRIDGWQVLTYFSLLFQDQKLFLDFP